jgi:hypothetical protein
MEDYYVSGLVCSCPHELWPGFDRQAGWGPQSRTKQQQKTVTAFAKMFNKALDKS